jgi:CHAD domain-containing protein
MLVPNHTNLRSIGQNAGLTVQETALPAGAQSVHREEGEADGSLVRDRQYATNDRVAHESDPMANTVKRIDQQRHELKALRYLLEFYPESLVKTTPLPRREDFQIPDCRRIYDALTTAKTRADAMTAIRNLDLDETDLDSFLHLGGEYYYTYPKLVAERGEQFRRGQIELEAAS